MIMVYSIGDNLQLQEQRQLLHTNDGVNSLSWQILHTQQENQTTWPSLASSGKRTKDILIWEVMESAVSCTIKLPKPESHWTAQQKNTNWIYLAWSPIHSTEIYITSHIGQVLRYNVSGSKFLLLNPRFEQGHSRIAFTLCYSGAYHIITSSLDGQIIKWNIRNGKVVVNIKTQTGFPYSLDISSNNPDQVAIGYGDSVIKVWKCNQIEKKTKPGQQQRNFYESTSFWRGLRGQVENVQWHPTSEGLLAFSTEYGHVGIYDFYNSKCQTLKEYHAAGDGTPSMTWTGDLTSLLADKNMAGHNMTDTLITCGGKNGDLYIRNVSHPTQAPISLNAILRNTNPTFYTLLETKQSRCVSVSANPSGLYLALGNSDGSLEIYRLKNLKIVYASNYHRKKITSLHWKDIGDHSLLASGCDNGDIGVHKINHDIEIPPADSLTIETSPYGILKAHQRAITDLKWSHHADQILLASTSFDNLAIIWNMEPTPSIVSYFENHRGCVYSVCWQYLDPDIVLTGGDDRFIYMWNWKDFSINMKDLEILQKYVPVFIREKKRMTKRKPIKTEITGNSKKHGLDAMDSEATTSDMDSVKKRKTTNHTKNNNKTTTLFDATTTAIRTIDQTRLHQHCFELAVELYSSNDTAVDGMSFISDVKRRCEQADDDLYISKYTTLSPTTSEKVSTKTQFLNLITGNKNDIRKLIGVEVDLLNDNDNAETGRNHIPTTATFMGSDVKLALDIMRSNLFTLGSYIHAGDGMMLTDWIVLALSPMAGKETWLKMMEEQAQKLASSGFHHLAATCFLACSKVYEAINVYREASMFTEAIAMLKIRLPENDPLLATLLTEWAQQLQAKCQDELAALCYIQSGLPGCITNAANLLGRRGTESSSFWSACLMSLLNDGSKETHIERWLGMVNRRQTETLGTID
ncbi:unnamed protein product [Absidia cylindrospora]